jgi:hypothetical protein
MPRRYTTKRRTSLLPPHRLLIVSDGKPGHVNQAIAFCRHLGYPYDVVEVAYRPRWRKSLTYPADRLRIYSARIFTVAGAVSGIYRAVVSAGSATYYPNRTLARRLGAKAVAIMLPKGYRLDFDLIVAPRHDHPPAREGIIEVPINLTFMEPRGLLTPLPDSGYISFIIGGDSPHGKLDAMLLKHHIDRIREQFPGYRAWMTTSRRTPLVIEQMLRQYDFDQAYYYSEAPVNPLADFLRHSEYVFLTGDSSSMISEAVSFGTACVEVLPLAEKTSPGNKIDELIGTLAAAGCLHVYDGGIGTADKKIDLAACLRGVKL